MGVVNMANDKVKVATSKLTALADAIRAKSGGSEEITLNDIPTIVPSLGAFKEPGLYDYDTRQLIADEQYLLSTNMLRQRSYSNKPYYITIYNESPIEITDKNLALVLPDYVTYFESCTLPSDSNSGIVKIVVPESCTRLGTSNTRSGATKDRPMKKLYLSKNIQHFYWVGDFINTIEVDPDNPVYDSRNGYNGVIETESNKVVFAGLIGCDPMNLPDSVTAIGSGTFVRYNSTEVTVPAHIKNISESNTTSGAFAGNGIIEKVTILGQLDTLYNGFNYMSALKTFEFPNGIGNIKELSFRDCVSLEEVSLPYGLTKIGYNGFAGCKNLVRINIPDSILEIGNYAFSDTPITDITIPNSVSSINNNAFANMKNLTTIHYSGTATGAPWGATNATVVP